MANGNTINWVKLTRQDGIILLRAYLYAQAVDQRDAFKDDEWQTFLWNQTVEAVLAAPTITDLMRLIQPVTADEQPEYVVLEALCSYRPDDLKHVELQTPVAGGNDDK